VDAEHEEIAMTTTTATTPFARAAERAPRSLDELLDYDADALAVLYRSARVPHLPDVRGDLRGRMLATTVLKGPAARGARAFAASDVFPWRGKTFSPKDALRGEGINRVVVDRFKLYRFETSIARSRFGDFDALELNYDLPENPFFIRPIKDEIRELSPGLWLGQAWLDVGRAPRLVLYFGLTG
jgi:hypothetical protein